ncbi:MAG: hypothetical protein ACR2KC_00470 [Acidimicrobiales bacterium]
MAETADPRTPRRFAGLAAGSMAGGIRETSLVVSPDAANAQMAAELISAESAAEEGLSDEFNPTTDSTGQARTERRPGVLKRFYGVASLDPGRMARDAGRLAEEVVAHLNAIDGTDIEVTIEITATNTSGFAEPVRKLVSENAAALRLRQQGFESS